jgi:hypothetical protein
MTDEIRQNAVNFEAVKTSMSQSKAGTILRLAIHPNEVPASLHTDWVGARYMVAMVRLEDDESVAVNPQQMETQKLIQSAGLLCRNLDFAHFLWASGEIDEYDGTDDAKREEQVANYLRQHLGVQSRAEMSNNSVAREKFKELREQFMNHKRGA